MSRMPSRPDPTKIEEGGPPMGAALLIGVPLVAAFMALATWAPWVLLLLCGVFLFGMLSWAVGSVVDLVLELWRERLP
jgi:hypothetical protein